MKPELKRDMEQSKKLLRELEYPGIIHSKEPMKIVEEFEKYNFKDKRQYSKHANFVKSLCKAIDKCEQDISKISSQIQKSPEDRDDDINLLSINLSCKRESKQTLEYLLIDYLKMMY